MRRPAHLEGVELWTVEESVRRWAVYYTTYVFAVPVRMEGPWRWRYRGQDLTLHSDATMLMEPGEISVVTEAGGPADFRILLVQVPCLESELGDGLQGRHFETGQLDDPAAAAQHQRLWKALDEPAGDPLEQGYRLRKYLHFLFERAGEKSPRVQATGCARAVKRAREILESRFAQRVTLDDLARETGLSKFHLERNFHQRVGLPVHQYLKRVRIARALQMLRDGLRPSDVASLAGFSDQPHLTRVFREEMGFTPKIFWSADDPKRR